MTFPLTTSVARQAMRLVFRVNFTVINKIIDDFLKVFHRKSTLDASFDIFVKLLCGFKFVSHQIPILSK